MVRQKALLVAYGVHESGRREVIGIAVGEVESEAAWREFLRDLVARGLSGVRLAISDAHAGLRAAIGQVLARLLRLGELIPVRVPSVGEEAARDLVRAREDVRGDLMRARHRLSKFLLRHGRAYSGSAWTLAHATWLGRQRFDSPLLGATFRDYHEAVLATRRRREGLDGAILELAADPPWAPLVARLACLRGVSTLTAVALAVEIGDWQRLTGQSIGAYLGLTPSEDSSGARRRQGAITKTGNGHARRLLVEAAWQQRRPLRPSPALARRRAGQRPEVVDRAERAARRLHRRWARLEDERGTRSTVVAVAVARELAGWCWSLAVMDD